MAIVIILSYRYVGVEVNFLTFQLPYDCYSLVVEIDYIKAWGVQ